MLVHMVLRPAGEERLLGMAGSSGQLENTRMGPSEHAANLSKFDPLATSSLQGVEKVIHTAVRPASGPCDNERHLPYPSDIADAVGEAGCSSLASSDHAANSANSDVSMHRGLHESQDNARSIAYTHQVLSNEEQDDVACGEPHGNEDTRFLHAPLHQRKQRSCQTHKGELLCWTRHKRFSKRR